MWEPQGTRPYIGSLARIVSQQGGARPYDTHPPAWKLNVKKDGLTGKILYIKNSFHIAKASGTLKPFLFNDDLRNKDKPERPARNDSAFKHVDIIVVHTSTNTYPHVKSLDIQPYSMCIYIP